VNPNPQRVRLYPKEEAMEGDGEPERKATSPSSSSSSSSEEEEEGEEEREGEDYYVRRRSLAPIPYTGDVDAFCLLEWLSKELLATEGAAGTSGSREAFDMEEAEDELSKLEEIEAGQIQVCGAVAHCEPQPQPQTGPLMGVLRRACRTHSLGSHLGCMCES